MFAIAVSGNDMAVTEKFVLVSCQTFDADWPTRSLYHMMLNTAVGNEPVIRTILDTMRLVEGRPKATGFEQPRVPAGSR